MVFRPVASAPFGSCYAPTTLLIPARWMPWRGALLVVAAGLSASGCELVSLDGLSGEAGPGGTTYGGLPEGSTTGGDADGGNRDAGAPDSGGPGDGGAGTTDAAIGTDATDGDAAADPCDGGGILCNGTCVDPTSDPHNCNGCGNACSSGVCGSSVSESLAAMPTAWTFNGSATYNSFAPSAELTAQANGQAGTFIYDDPIVVDAFDVTFMFRMGLQGGARSDGIGFMIEQSGVTAVGELGGGLGMTGLTGYGVELDIYDNATCGDDSGDHVGVDDLTLCHPEEGTPTSLAETDVTGTVDLADAHWHAAEITLSNGAVTVSIDGAVVGAAVTLPALQVGTPYFFGFAGGTGGLLQADGGSGGYRQEVRDVVMTFPTPRCL